MKNRPSRRLLVRRFIVGLTAAVIGGIGSLSIATPSQANVSCDMLVDSHSAADGRNGAYGVDVDLANAGPARSAGWVIYVGLPANYLSVITQDANPMPEYGPGWYRATDQNKVIPFGWNIRLHFLVTMPTGEALTTPTSYGCSLW